MRHKFGSVPTASIRPILVAGSGRSGTTWIGDTIASCAGCCPIFEPLNAARVPQVPRWGVRSDRPGAYLDPERPHPEWEAYFDALFAGRVSNAWTRQDWRRVPRLLMRWRPAERVAYRVAMMRYRQQEAGSSRYLIKEIRANLLLDWLQRRFPVDVIFVTRHPCAVIGSRLRLGWKANLDEILSQSDLMADFLEPHRETIAAADTPLRRQAVLWCVENLVPLSQARDKDWLVCSYEQCVLDPSGVFDQIIRHFDLTRTEATEQAQKRVVSAPSSEARRASVWHSPLSEQDGEEVLRICERFGLGLYGRQTMPLGESCNKNINMITMVGEVSGWA